MGSDRACDCKVIDYMTGSTVNVVPCSHPRKRVRVEGEAHCSRTVSNCTCGGMGSVVSLVNSKSEFKEWSSRVSRRRRWVGLRVD